MEKKTNWGKIIAIGCGGCSFAMCLGVVGSGALFYEEIAAVVEAAGAISDVSSMASVEILGLTGGGSSVWDDQVKAIILKNFDKDMSGEIDSSSEVDAIGCDVWNAINIGLLSGGEYSSNFTAIYGFDPELIWVGYALGFSESVRADVFRSAPPCFSVTGDDLSGGDEIGELGPDLIFDASDFSFGPTAEAILALPGGGSSEWDDKVEAILLAKFDRTKNGSLDVFGEVNVISCDIWAALDIGMRSGGEYSSSLYTVYGFDPSLMWVGSAIGFDESMRSDAYNKAVSCHSSN